MEPDDLRAAQQAERKWLISCHDMLAGRTEHMRHAWQLGMHITEIAELIGLSRQHVSEIVHGRRS